MGTKKPHTLTTLFKACHVDFWDNMQKLLSSLRAGTTYPSISKLIGILFLQLSKLYRVSGLMVKHGTFDEVILDAPAGYFVVHAQRHRSFHGTEFGYACWYIQLTLDYALRDLARRHSPKLIADRLESTIAGFQLNNHKLFPRLLPSESLDLVSRQCPSLIPLEASPRATFCSSYPGPVEPIVTPNSSLACELTGGRNSPTPANFTTSEDIPLSISSPLAERHSSSQSSLECEAGGSIGIPNETYYELMECADALTLSPCSDGARRSDLIRPVTHLPQPNGAVQVAGHGSDDRVTAEKTVRRGRNPRVRVVSPNGTKRSPRPAKPRRRATPYPERDAIFKPRSIPRLSAEASLPALPPPSPYRGTEGQDHGPSLSQSDAHTLH